MPSTFTTNLGIEKPADAEQTGLWGDTVNLNSDILDRAINGTVVLALSGTASTLQTLDGQLADGQYRVLVLGGAPSGTHTITIAPATAQKVYFVQNGSGQSVVFTQGSGGNVTIANGDSAIIYADGAGATARVANLTDHFAMGSVKITGGVITGITDLAIADGGTGASNAATARTNLGLGTMATQNASAVAILGGSVSGITDLAVADGGTGASDAATARTNLGLAIGTNVQAYYAGLQSIGQLTATADQMLYTTGANLYATTALTSFGRSLIDDADAATARTTLGLGTMATQNASAVAITGGSITGITDLAIADGGTGASDAATACTNLGLGTIATQNASAVSITGGVITGITDLAIADGGTGASDAATARTNLGLAIGTNVQAYYAGLQSIGQLTTAADQMLYTTGANLYTTTALTSFGRSLIDDANAATARTTLGLGTMATQNASAVAITGGSITGITDLAIADGGTGASDAATARTNLGLGTIATQNASAVAITGGSINGTAIGGSVRAAGNFTTLNANGNVTLGDATSDVVTIVGSVGIGTSSPDAKLDVRGDAFVTGSVYINGVVNEDRAIEVGSGRTGSGNSYIDFIGDTTYTDYGLRVIRGPGANAVSQITHRGTGVLALEALEAGSVSVRTTGVDRMVIDSAGRVGIGTTAPQFKLVVLGGSAAGQNSTVAIKTDNTDGASALLLGDSAEDTVGELRYDHSSNTMTLRTNNANRVWVNSGGEVRVGSNTDQGTYNIQCNGSGVWGAGAYVNGSDARLKDDVAPIGSCLNVVRALNPVVFRYKPDFSSDQSLQPGFIAQELQEVFAGKPYVEGIVQGGPSYLNVAYQTLIPVLTAAIKEADHIIQSLTDRIAALETAMHTEV